MINLANATVNSNQFASEERPGSEWARRPENHFNKRNEHEKVHASPADTCTYNCYY